MHTLASSPKKPRQNGIRSSHHEDQLQPVPVGAGQAQPEQAPLNQLVGFVDVFAQLQRESELARLDRRFDRVRLFALFDGLGTYLQKPLGPHQPSSPPREALTPSRCVFLNLYSDE